MYTERRWGRGRVAQLGQRFVCRIGGHEFSPWHFDWPWDVPIIWPDDHGLPDDMFGPDGAVRDPHHDEGLLWVRRCKKGCGCMQTTLASLAEAGLLPGERRTLFDHPVRRNYR